MTKGVTAADRAAIEAVIGQLDEQGGRALAEVARLLIQQLPTLRIGSSTSPSLVFFSTPDVRDAWHQAIDMPWVICVTLRRPHGARQPFKGLESTAKFYDELPTQLRRGGWTNAAGEWIR